MHSLPSSFALFKASGGREPPYALNYVWFRCSIGCTPVLLNHQWEADTPASQHLHLHQCTVSPWKRMKFRSTTYFGTVAEQFYLLIYKNCVFLQLYTITLKWLKWKVVRHLLGNHTGRQCSQPNRNGKRLFPMSVGCPRSGQVDDGDACGTLRSLMGIEEITSPAEI